VTTWLSEEWFDQVRSLAAGPPEHPGVSGRIQVEMTGGPDGEVRCYWVIQDGRLVECAGGAVTEPDVTLTLGWAEAVALEQGALDPSVAFMQGRLKVGGSMAVTLRLLSLAATPAVRDLRQKIAGVTEF